jgi:hypothetical protein
MRPDQKTPRRAGRRAVLTAVLVLAVSAVVAWRWWTSQSAEPERTLPPASQSESSPAGTPSDAAPTAAAPAAEPVVPVDLPTPPPGLDRELAADYRKALEGQGFSIGALTIVDTRAGGGMRRAQIIYRTRAGSTLAALRPEIIRMISPGANPRLALDQIIVRATRPDGAPIIAVTITVADLDRWLKTQITDTEFYARWTTGTPAP